MRRFHGAQTLARRYTREVECSFAPNARSSQVRQKCSGRGENRKSVLCTSHHSARAAWFPTLCVEKSWCMMGEGSGTNDKAND